LRAFLPEVQQASKAKAAALVDVRSPDEFTGKILAPPGLPETCQRGGHIPGAKSIPWGKNCNEDGTFKNFEELRELYSAQGITGDQPIIAYCRIGERSSLTWFALKHLLGFKDVKNYDGSWTEWERLVGARWEAVTATRHHGGHGGRGAMNLLDCSSVSSVVERFRMKPEEYARRQEELAGWQVSIETYKLGDVYHCTIANVDRSALRARRRRDA
jgi:rhodanese-related sulfurtransferase